MTEPQNKNKKATFPFCGRLAVAMVAASCRIALLPFTQTVERKGGAAVRERTAKNGAAELAWEMFEKTGSIAYYMLFLELNNGKHH